MTSIVRRAASRLFKMAKGSAAPAQVANQVVGYSLDLGAGSGSQLFFVDSNGRISQVTPAPRLATPGVSLSATIAAFPGETIVLLPGTHVLDADVVATTSTLKFMRGAVITAAANRILGCDLDFSEGGSIQPANTITFETRGRIALPPTRAVFDVSLGGVFHINYYCLPALTPYNFGGDGTGVSYSDAQWQACIDACAWSGGGAFGGIVLYIPPSDWKLGSVLTTDSRGDKVCLFFRTSNCKVVGAGENHVRFHFNPDDVADLNIVYYLMRFELSTGPLLECGLSGVAFGAGGDTTRVKRAIDLHDVRDFRLENINVAANWTDTSKRSGLLRYRGRDSNTFHNIKTNTDIPIIIWFNDDETAPLDANGIPTAYRDGKDFDHTWFAHMNLGVSDNIYKASIWIPPGVVGRNLDIQDVANVGGGLVCVDYLDLDGVPFGGDPITPRRVSNNWSIAHGRTEGLISPPDIPVASLTQVGGVATVVTNARHSMLSGMLFTISGATPSAYNGEHWVLDVIDDYTFTYPINSGTASPATGTILVEDPQNYFGLRIQRNQNAPLHELFIEDYLLGEGADARRAINTGASSYTGVAWAGFRANGVGRVVVQGTTRYDGTQVPVEVDDDNCVLEIDSATELTPSDNQHFFPEHQAQLEYLDVLFRSWWLMQERMQGAEISDQQTANLTNYPLHSSAAEPTYMQLVDAYINFWVKFTHTAHERFFLNITAAEIDPDVHPIAVVGVHKLDPAYAPGARDTFCELSGADNGGFSAGPSLRPNASGQLYVHNRSSAGGADQNGQPGTMSYLDGVPFIWALVNDPISQTLRAYIRKETGEEETLVGPFIATVGNAANKGYGAVTTNEMSVLGWMRMGGWATDANALINWQSAFDRLHWKSLSTSLYPTGYMSGLAMTRTSNTAVTVGPGACRTSDDRNDVVVTTPLTADLAASGAGGLDTGALAANKWYALHLIEDPTGENAPKALWSLSKTNPVLPAGYSKFRFREWWRVDGSSHLLHQTEYGEGPTRVVIFDEDLSVLLALNAVGGVAFADLSLAAWAPPSCDNVKIQTKLVAPTAIAAVGDVLTVRPNGGSSADGPQVFGAAQILDQPLYGQGWIGCDSSQVIEWKTTDADDKASIWVLGFEVDL